VRFLVDEDVSPCLKFVLQEWGHSADAVGLREDLASEADDVILAAAECEQRVLVTFNADHFEALHQECRAAGRSHPGIVVCARQEGYRSFDRLLRWMRNMLAAVSPEDFANDLHYLHTFT